MPKRGHLAYNDGYNKFTRGKPPAASTVTAEKGWHFRDMVSDGVRLDADYSTALLARNGVRETVTA
jgi:hypothetical protein